MEAPTAPEGDDSVVGLVIADDAGGFFAIAWDDLQHYRVPAAWATAVAALVRGEEPAASGEDVWGCAGAVALTGAHTLLIRTVTETRRARLAAQRLEAWALVR
jgi:hypothetical protein